MKRLRAIGKKIEKSLKLRGVAGTLIFSLKLGMTLASPKLWRVRQAQRRADEEFDRRHGVDTGGVIPMSNLVLSGDDWVFGVAYQAIRGSVDFAEILRDLAIPYEDFTFVDLGSGKGRAVLLASLIPFKRVEGVEFSKQLHDVAENNVSRWPIESRRCAAIELRCLDARDYRFPDGPFVLYMYNPFERPIMERIVENLRATFQYHPRRIVVLYFTPKYSELLERTTFLNKVVVRPGYHLYDTVVAA